MNLIENRGDSVTITLPTGHFVEYDGPRLRRQTGNDLHRMVAQIIADAIKSKPEAKPAAPVPISTKATPKYKDPRLQKPGEAAHIKTEDAQGNYVPSGCSQDDGN